MKSLLYEILPVPVIYRLLEIRETFRGNKKFYYSQSGEDIILGFLTRKQKKGFYVDVGANHPKRGSNTYLLYKRGWRGINIEPDPYLYSLLKRYRKHDSNLQIGIGDMPGKAIYYRFADSHMNTFSGVRADELVKRGWKLLEKKMIQIKSLKEVIPSGQIVDVMNVDVEGYDMQVLQSNDWEKVRPKIIVVESLKFDISNPTEDAIYNFLIEKGYVVHSRAGYSILFCQI